MKLLFCAAKRTLCRPFLLLLLVACCAVIALSAQLPSAAQVPAGGVYAEGDSEASQQMVAYLTANGFVLCRDREEMLEQVARGQLDCALVIPKDLPVLLERGEVEGCLTFVCSPSSLAPQLYKSHGAAALFRRYAPYLTARSFEGSEVSREAVLEEYEAMFREGYAFSFQVLTAGEAASPENMKVRSMVMGAVSLPLCALIIACAPRHMGGGVALRLGLKRTMLAVVLPDHLLWCCAAICAAGGGVWLAGLPELLPAVAIYALVLTGVGLLLTALLPTSGRLYLLLPILLILSAALCPIYTDLGKVIPLAGAVRNLLPPYWLWLICKAPRLWLALSVGSVAVGAAALAGRYRLTGKLK